MSNMNPSESLHGGASLEVKVAAATERIQVIHELLVDNRETINRTEERMVAVVNNLADRLEKITSDIKGMMDQRAKDDGDRITALENKNIVIWTAIGIFGFLAPTITTVAFFFVDAQRESRSEVIQLAPEDVIELRGELTDLRRHRRLGGPGSHWISPSRRTYQGGTEEDRGYLDGGSK